MEREQTFTEEEIVAFLLGDCDDSLALRMEERLFANDNFYQRMQEVKASLIAQLVKGRLPKILADKFNLQVQRSALLRSEVEQARAAHAPLVTLWKTRKFREMLHRASHWQLLQLAFVSVTILIVGFFISRPIIRKAVATVHRQNESATSTSIAKHTRPSEAKPLIIFLPAGVLRSDRNVPVIHLPVRGKMVNLQIEVRGDRQVYSSVSLLQGSEMAFHQADMQVKTEGQIRFLDVTLPSKSLRLGHCTIRLELHDTSSTTGPYATVERMFEVVD